MNLKFPIKSIIVQSKVIRHSYFNFKHMYFSLDEVSKNLYKVLEESCNSCKSNLISLSGGLDSSIIAYFLKQRKPKTIAIITEDFVSTDLTYCQMISKEMQLSLSINYVKTATILEAIEDTIKILKNFNDIEIRNNVVMYLAIKWAKENGDFSLHAICCGIYFSNVLRKIHLPHLFSFSFLTFRFAGIFSASFTTVSFRNGDSILILNAFPIFLCWKMHY